MHPVTAQAIAAERSAEFRADAAGARKLRRSRRDRPMWPFAGISRAAREPAAPPARKPLRDPRAA